MNQQMAHLLTLWCAVLAKANKGISRMTPSGLSVTGSRLLCQLARPETPFLSESRIAHALVIRPADAAVAVAVLQGKNLIEVVPDVLCGSEDLRYHLTETGFQMQESLASALSMFNYVSWSQLQEADFSLLMDMVYDAMVRPGSFFSEITTRDYRSSRIPDHYYVTCITMLASLVDSAAKCAEGLSLTDFRFLLELYPKRRGAEKMLRAKELSSRLAVGRAYISTSSLRLEEEGYLERVPDPQDMRGVLLHLTPLGKMAVSQIGDDVAVAFDSLFRPRREQHVDMIRMMRLLLQGTDEAMNAGGGGRGR